MTHFKPGQRREWFQDLRPGELIVVKYGSNGTQLAQVERHVRGNPSKCWVRKFRVNSKRWTNPVQIRETDLIHPASDRAQQAKRRIARAAKDVAFPMKVPEVKRR